MLYRAHVLLLCLLPLAGGIFASCSESTKLGRHEDASVPSSMNDASVPDATPGDGDGDSPGDGDKPVHDGGTHDAGSSPDWPSCDGCTAKAPLAANSPWPKFRGNMEQSALTKLVPVTSHDKPWSYQTGKGIFSSPVIGPDGAIYVGSADRSFYALEHDGTLRFKVDTGEIIDSAGLVDDKGRVYFASGDSILRAVDAKTGESAWEFQAEDPSVNKALINWFEGNVAIGPDAKLYAPNDNFSVYALNRDTGERSWKWLMNDQTWSSPAVDAESGTLYIGNNYIVPFGVLGAFWRNIFAIDKDGKQVWNHSVQATVAASPVLLSDRIVLGGFDGYVRALAKSNGAEQWAAPTIDHVYASAALLPNGDIVQPSTDGTVYCLAADSGNVKWRFDTREPIRSSPAVDGAGHIYFGGGDGRLYVLNQDGTRRFSIKLIDEDRNDMNSSPAIGFDAVYLGAENGQIWSVPYDYCLGDAGKADARCEVNPKEDLPDDGAHLFFVSPFGSYLTHAPAQITRNQALAFSLFVRKSGDTELTLIQESSLKVTLDPASDIDVLVSGDRHFLTVVPSTEFAGEKVTIHLTGSYLDNPTRSGLKLSGGSVAGTFDESFEFSLVEGKTPAGLPIPAHIGDQAGTLELYRAAVPLPTILPSYNQIGFDSLHYLVGFVEGTDDHGIGWVVGGKLDAQGHTLPDPASKVLFPVEIARRAGLMTFVNQAGFTANAMNADIPFDSFRASVTWGDDATKAGSAGLHVTTNCNNIPTYGSFLINLGFCNPDSAIMNVFGSFNLRKHGTGLTSAPEGVGDVAFDIVSPILQAKKLRATITNTKLASDKQNLGIFAIDTSTGKPLAISYGVSTERTDAGDGTIDTVQVPLPSTLPESLRVYLMVDTYPVATATLRTN
jgi:outer membrane protein assembly factor BamB